MADEKLAPGVYVIGTYLGKDGGNFADKETGKTINWEKVAVEVGGDDPFKPSNAIIKGEGVQRFLAGTVVGATVAVPVTGGSLKDGFRFDNSQR